MNKRVLKDTDLFIKEVNFYLGMAETLRDSLKESYSKATMEDFGKKVSPKPKSIFLQGKANPMIVGQDFNPTSFHKEYLETRSKGGVGGLFEVE